MNHRDTKSSLFQYLDFCACVLGGGGGGGYRVKITLQNKASNQLTISMASITFHCIIEDVGEKQVVFKNETTVLGYQVGFSATVINTRYKHQFVNCLQ